MELAAAEPKNLRRKIFILMDRTSKFLERSRWRLNNGLGEFLYRFSDQLRFPQSFLHTRSNSKKSISARRAAILLCASLVQLIEIK
jgi:hypothetical protein